MTGKTSHNSTYPKVAVQWLNQALCFYQSLCLVDSEVLRNRHLRVAANRSPDIAFGSSGERTEDYILHSTPRLTATS
ncbi:hypothetical protein SAMN05216364_10991 [Porphyromonadaceae bacterium KHP3R9]|nr:hypothetical protein SAMN05216364_10991 [Porphyromonadaceae bacterium KHP3R9]